MVRCMDMYSVTDEINQSHILLCLSVLKSIELHFFRDPLNFEEMSA